MSKFGYHIIKAVTLIFHFLPLKIHYLTSNLIFIIIYYIVRYRRIVVEQNLANSFPDKSKSERKTIERRFYQHFCDVFIETLYFDRISESEIRQRYKVKNVELLDFYHQQGRQIIALTGHYNNWEWSSSYQLHTKYRFYAVYKKLRSKNFDLFYYKLRSKFGCTPIEKKEAVKHLVKDLKDKMPSLTALISDQSPKGNEIQYWTTFLNQETPILTGPEKMARMLNAVVVFANTRKIKRGYYELEFKLLFENAKATEPFEITEQMARTQEEEILEDPAFWLWTHKRWKHKKQ